VVNGYNPSYSRCCRICLDKKKKKEAFGNISNILFPAPFMKEIVLSPMYVFGISYQ
jgi:hypothetical protein